MRSSSSRRIVYILFIIGFSHSGSAAYACGFCPGDRIAAVYCHESIQLAKSSGRQYVVLEVLEANDKAEFETAVQALKKAKGVDKKSLRSAFAQKTVSFILARNQSPEAIIKQ